MRIHTANHLFGIITFTLAIGCAGPTTDKSPQSPENGAAPPKMKMTTEVPEGVATHDRLETPIGTLTSFDGVPDKNTTQVVYDNLDFQRATQAYLSTLQIASLDAMRRWMETKRAEFDALPD